jgi:hypothetical protein
MSPHPFVAIRTWPVRVNIVTASEWIQTAAAPWGRRMVGCPLLSDNRAAEARQVGMSHEFTFYVRQRASIGGPTDR